MIRTHPLQMERKASASQEKSEEEHSPFFRIHPSLNLKSMLGPAPYKKAKGPSKAEPEQKETKNMSVSEFWSTKYSSVIWKKVKNEPKVTRKIPNYLIIDKNKGENDCPKCFAHESKSALFKPKTTLLNPSSQEILEQIGEFSSDFLVLPSFNIKKKSSFAGFNTRTSFCPSSSETRWNLECSTPPFKSKAKNSRLKTPETTMSIRRNKSLMEFQKSHISDKKLLTFSSKTNEILQKCQETPGTQVHLKFFSRQNSPISKGSPQTQTKGFFPLKNKDEKVLRVSGLSRNPKEKSTTKRKVPMAIIRYFQSKTENGLQKHLH